MICKTSIDPIQPVIIRLLRDGAASTSEVHRRISEAGEVVTQERLSSALHALHQSGAIQLRKLCQIPDRRRQLWHLPGMDPVKAKVAT